MWWKVDLGGVYNIYSINILFKKYDGYGMYLYIIFMQIFQIVQSLFSCFWNEIYTFIILITAPTNTLIYINTCSLVQIDFLIYVPMIQKHVSINVGLYIHENCWTVFTPFLFLFFFCFFVCFCFLFFFGLYNYNFKFYSIVIENVKQTKNTK